MIHIRYKLLPKSRFNKQFIFSLSWLQLKTISNVNHFWQDLEIILKFQKTKQIVK